MPTPRDAGFNRVYRCATITSPTSLLTPPPLARVDARTNRQDTSKDARATTLHGLNESVGTTTSSGGGGGAPRGGTSGRWTRTRGMPGSSASTVVPGMSPSVDGGGAEDSSGSVNGDRSSGGLQLEEQQLQRAGRIKDDMNSNNSNVPAPLDLSAIPVAAPPPHLRPGGAGEKFGSSSSSASCRPVVLQGAALESLQRLGRPGSCVSDRSKATSSTHGSGVTRAAAAAAATGGVPVGAAAGPSVGPTSGSSRRQPSSSSSRLKQKHRLRSREPGSKGPSSYASRSFAEDSERGKGGGSGRPAGGLRVGGGTAWANSDSGVWASQGRTGPGPTARNIRVLGTFDVSDDRFFVRWLWYLRMSSRLCFCGCRWSCSWCFLWCTICIFWQKFACSSTCLRKCPPPFQVVRKKNLAF